MPNFCENIITISTKDQEKYEIFISKMNSPNAQGEMKAFSFHHHVPRPAEEAANWYNWNLENWGAKWDAGVGEIKYEQKTIYGTLYFYIIIDCDTPWDPPYAWARSAASNYDMTITVKYREGGYQLAGTYIAISDYYFENIKEEYIPSPHPSLDDEIEVFSDEDDEDDNEEDNDIFNVTITDPLPDTHNAPAA